MKRKKKRALLSLLRFYGFAPRCKPVWGLPTCLAFCCSAAGATDVVAADGRREPPIVWKTPLDHSLSEKPAPGFYAVQREVSIPAQDCWESCCGSATGDSDRTEEPEPPVPIGSVRRFQTAVAGSNF